MENKHTTKTNYKLEKDGNNIKVLKDRKIKAHGFGDNASALNAIWVIEGKVHDHFYVADKDMNVSCVDRGAL